VKGARNSLIDLENMTDDERRKLSEEFRKLRETDAGLASTTDVEK
jgi:hypothetical protein